MSRHKQDQAIGDAMVRLTKGSDWIVMYRQGARFALMSSLDKLVVVKALRAYANAIEAGNEVSASKYEASPNQ